MFRVVGPIALTALIAASAPSQTALALVGSTAERPTRSKARIKRIPRSTRVLFARQEHLDPVAKWRKEGRPIIAVLGSADKGIPKQVLERAYHLGELLAERNMVLLNGACPGAPDAAKEGAKSKGGITAGVSPHKSKAAHERAGAPTHGFDVIQLTRLPRGLRRHKGYEPNYLGRELTLIDRADALIFIRGRSGTASEFTIGMEFGKPIGLLGGTGGVVEILPKLVRQSKRAGKQPAAPVIYDTNSERLLRRLDEAIRLSQQAGHRGPLGDISAAELATTSEKRP